MQTIAQDLYDKAAKQASAFQGFLDSLKTADNTIIDTHILKSPNSIISKILRKDGDIQDIADFLRASVLVWSNEQLDKQLLDILASLEKIGIKDPVIELKHRESGYKGLHLQFEINGIKSEIQLHTQKGWEIKKQQDEIYHILREEEVKPTKTQAEIDALLNKSVEMGQANDFSIKDFASFELNLMVSSNSETSVLRKKSPVLANSNQEPFLNSKQPPSVDLPLESKAYNRPDSTLSQNDSLSTGSGNKPLESIENPLTKDTDIIPQSANDSTPLSAAQKKQVAEIDKNIEYHTKKINQAQKDLQYYGTKIHKDECR